VKPSAQAIAILALIVGGAGLFGVTPLLSRTNPPIAEEDLLDIGIVALDPGIEKKSYLLTGYEYINPELRRSESSFIAIHLMRTLQATESFGLVRMMPRNAVAADLFVTGRIRESSGRRLALELEVVDSTGHRWLKKVYRQKAYPSSYSLAFHSDLEPFQEVYDQFAADLIHSQSRMKDPRLEEIRHVAELRFAAQLAPGIFGDYLELDRKGRIRLDRLPSRDDPMLARIRTIQRRDEFFLDLLTDRYQGFYTSMDKPYDNFRATRYEVELALRDARAQHNLANARSLFAPPDQSPLERHRAADRATYFRRQVARKAMYLDVISDTFATELDPLKLELDGEVIRFEGTIEDQYRQWQELLERIFETETGMSADNGAFSEDINARH
jgi:hypothetical protein